MKTIKDLNIYLAVDENEQEFLYPVEPFRNNDNNTWIIDKVHMCTEEKGCMMLSPTMLPKGSIEKLLGYKLTWKDEPISIDYGY